jgi:PAS domain-containing protein
MKKDAAYQLASATAQWWMDLTDEGWFDAPELVEPIRRLKAIEERLQQTERRSFGEVALVTSQLAMMYQAPREGLHNATLKMYRNWHLSRMGAPFEQLMVEDLARQDLPSYKLYIMANVFYLSTEHRELVERVVKRNGATVLWIYAPGYLNDSRASLDNMRALTGLRFGVADIRSELNVSITNYDHTITHGLPYGFAYGTSVEREQYSQPPKIQYMPDTEISPVFYVDDTDASVLGLEQATQRPGIVLKDFGDWRSVYSSAPLLPWRLMRNIARHAGVHIFDENGDMLWANNAFLAIYSQTSGKRQVRFPKPVTVEDAYNGSRLGDGITSLELDMSLWDTRLLYLG